MDLGNDDSRSAHAEDFTSVLGSENRKLRPLKY